MNLQQFKFYIQEFDIKMFNRCNLINRLITIKKDWSYILRSLLFASNKRIISKQYLLSKIEFMIKHPKNPHEFLDMNRFEIYQALKKELTKPSY